MVVTEIKEAVIDIVNFIIPPFIKVLVTLFIAYYLTDGTLTSLLFSNLNLMLKHISISSLNTVFDKLYLSSIVRILAILLLICIAYLINRITIFLGSLMPIKFIYYNSYFYSPYISEIWKYYPEIDKIYNLQLTLDKEFKQLELERNTPFFEGLKSQEDKQNKELNNLNFLYFLFLFILICKFALVNYYSFTLNPSHFNLLMCLNIIIAIALYLRSADNAIQTTALKLLIIDAHLKTNNAFTQTTDPEKLKYITDQVASIQKSGMGIWKISIGYKLSWLKSFKYYEIPMSKMIRDIKLERLLKKNDPQTFERILKIRKNFMRKQIHRMIDFFENKIVKSNHKRR